MITVENVAKVCQNTEIATGCSKPMLSNTSHGYYRFFLPQLYSNIFCNLVFCYICASLWQPSTSQWQSSTGRTKWKEAVFKPFLRATINAGGRRRTKWTNCDVFATQRQLCMTKTLSHKTISYVQKRFKYCMKALPCFAGVLVHARFPLDRCFCWWLSVFNLSYLCLFTRSRESSVWFLLLCDFAVLVLYSYQESTLLWRPWIPLMKIKLCVMNYKLFEVFSHIVGFR